MDNLSNMKFEAPINSDRAKEDKKMLIFHFRHQHHRRGKHIQRQECRRLSATPTTLESFFMFSIVFLLLCLLMVAINHAGFPIVTEACYKFPDGVRDPCIDLNCPFGAECIRSKDGKKAECVCPQKCYTFGDSVGSRPVCGSDGRDYPNDCELRRRACAHNKSIESKFPGRCDPCDQIDCPVTQVCQLDENRNPICRCNAICNLDFKPVCASDGLSYLNECILRVEACKSKKSLRILYNGECGSGRGTNPCESLSCNPHQECEIDRYGIATCVCPESCPPVLKPVCGSDDQTYDNLCELKRKSCLKSDLVSVKFHGICEDEDNCRKLDCSSIPGSICEITGGQAVCSCPVCTEEYKPVCSSNGITFQNECKLRQYGCEHGVDISLTHDKPCRGCEGKHCDNYGLCKSLELSSSSKNGGHPAAATCICPELCPTAGNKTAVGTGSPVCGSDGITYESECELRRHSCTKKTFITVASRGACDVCLNVHCKYGARCEKGRCICPTECPDTIEPICSTSGVTFTNECHMRKAACQRNVDLAISFYGECSESSKKSEVSDTGFLTGVTAAGGYVKTCDINTCKFGGICDYDPDGIPHCICSYHCPSSTINSDHETVCGSDGRLYENECKLQEEACRRQQEIKPQSYRSCEESKVTPCDGDPPILDNLTGKEMNCGHEGKTCPRGSYCHKTLHFAKCCKDKVHVKSCDDSPFGCCPDGKTPAGGPNHAGCPSICGCNRLGSYSLTCDPSTNQCHCKPGVGGLQCDRCEAGFWGLHKISEGNSGCIPCTCDPRGSLRDDCEQMTGRCVCKPGVQGMKCNVCPDGTVLEEDGCIDVSLTKTTIGSCMDIRCKFGAVCKEIQGRGSQCVCEQPCDFNVTALYSHGKGVCGSDGITYPSFECLQRASCKLQKKIVKLRDDRCRGSFATTSTSPEVVTPGPVRRSTEYKSSSFISSSGEKSTRELSWITVSEQMSTMPTDATPTLPDPLDILPIRIPSFNGDAFIESHRLQGYTRLTIEIDFVSFTENGLLLYNGQTASGEGDFVSISLKNGYVEFRFNLGSGTEILRSPQKILLGKLVKVVAKRYLKDGTLTVEGQEDVAGKSSGDLKSLDLVESLYIGSVPLLTPKIVDNVGLKQGFVGCIHRIRVGSKELDLKMPGSKDILRNIEVIDCSDNPCSSHPCKNEANCFPDKNHPDSFSCSCEEGFTGRTCEIPVSPCVSSENSCVRGSTCTKLPGGSFACLCPPGRSGTLCSEVDRGIYNISIPEFNSFSYMKTSTLTNVAQSFVIEVWFMTRERNGLILFNGQKHAEGRGDFFSLSVNNGHIEFQFDLGSGGNNSLTLVSQQRVVINRWHRVRITRVRKFGTLQLDDHSVVSGQTSGSLSELNLDEPFFVGGHELVKEISSVKTGLNGAIQRLVINGDVWDDVFSKAASSHLISDYKGPPCTTPTSSPCINEGICIPHLNDFVCKCPPRFTGKRCHKPLTREDMDRAVAFEGNTIMSFSNKLSDEIKEPGLASSEVTSTNDAGSVVSQRENHFEISIKTHSKSGLILWTNKGTTLKTDYLAVAVIDGFVELSYNLGKQKELFFLRGNIRVDDGRWHVISIERNKRHAALQVDSHRPVTGVSEVGANELNTDGLIWLGGSKHLPAGLPTDYYASFVGCMKDFQIEGEPISLTAHSLSSTTVLRFCHD